jgi:hypothetical protein
MWLRMADPGTSCCATRWVIKRMENETRRRPKSTSDSATRAAQMRRLARVKQFKYSGNSSRHRAPTPNVALHNGKVLTRRPLSSVQFRFVYPGAPAV